MQRYSSIQAAQRPRSQLSLSRESAFGIALHSSEMRRQRPSGRCKCTVVSQRVEAVTEEQRTSAHRVASPPHTLHQFAIDTKWSVRPISLSDVSLLLAFHSCSSLPASSPPPLQPSSSCSRCGSRSRACPHWHAAWRPKIPPQRSEQTALADSSSNQRPATHRGECKEAQAEC